jgi:hypothetical protein
MNDDLLNSAPPDPILPKYSLRSLHPSQTEETVYYQADIHFKHSVPAAIKE